MTTIVSGRLRPPAAALAAAAVMALTHPPAGITKAETDAPPPAGPQTKLLSDVESQADIQGWQTAKGSVRVSTKSPLRGKASAEVRPGTYIVLHRGRGSGIPGDWSGYDTLAIDFHNTTGKPLSLYVLVGDKDWQAKDGGTYWNRHNSRHSIPPGKYTFTLPTIGLFRGEAGSRYNDIKHAIKPAEIVRLDLGIGRPADGDKPVYLDNFRLIRIRVPDFIRAFDFGPAEQNIEPGFTPVSWNTVYSRRQGYGLGAKATERNRARDDTFPTVLYKDWVNMSEGWRDHEFRVDLPNGKYHVFTVFSDCGYWGGEAIRHTKRHIEAEGRVVWSEDLGSRGSYWKPNYLFEHVEPRVGDDLWDLYVARIFEPRRFAVRVSDGQLNLKWHADKPWSTKVSCVIIYPDTNRAEGRAFCERTVARQRRQFTVSAAETVPPAGGTLAAIPEAEKAKGYVFFVTSYENDTYQTTIPGPGQIQRQKSIYASLGEQEPVSFAVRPLRDMGKATVTVSDFRGKDGVIPKGQVAVKVVRHLTRRRANSLSYLITPQILRDFDTVSLPKGVTREFVAIIRVPRDARPGRYSGAIRIRSDAGLDETLDVTLTVYPFRLDGTEFLFGFAGAIPDLKVARMLRRLGFTTYAVGRKIDLKGFARDGTPQLDFTRMDAYMKMLKAAGFTHAGHPDDGLKISHIGYTKDEAFFGRYEKLTGLSYVELLRRVFDAVEKHSAEQGWPPQAYMLVDETRNREVAKRQVAQIKAINEASSWIKTGGSFSVSYARGRDPDDYHQRIFEALRAPALNRHDESCLRMAEQLGKELYTYNQGRSRYSFGAYQWSEYRKGVKGRLQWHLHIQHGFQFFDLDGREPDTGMLYFGRDGPILTLDLLRCAEGADDFYYCQTLHNRIEQLSQAGAGRAALEPARAVLREIETRIAVNERRRPAWLDNDALRRRCARAIMYLETLKQAPKR